MTEVIKSVGDDGLIICPCCNYEIVFKLPPVFAPYTPYISPEPPKRDNVVQLSIVKKDGE